MAKWNELLPALNQKFNSHTGTSSTAKTVERTTDIATQEHVVSLEDRMKADVFEPEDFKYGPMADGVTKPEKRKRLIDVITETSLRGTR
ncbi:hypothetical protein [Herminiimonas arsenitoxidans]|uniref:hypothetical protein n=1 Tax=Herminiimonas arsenitoxidans TaxID=1809410 RepID=UPI000970638A|nr:hypothetical protein [Herminiimonas arsenitoxidans]